MKRNWENLEQWIKLYDEGKSIRYIAKQYSEHPNTVLRQLVKSGKTIKSKSEISNIMVAEGTHATAGKQRGEKTKELIGLANVKAWDSKTEEEIKSHSEKLKKVYNKKSPEEIKSLREKCIKGLQDSSKKGSKLEHWLNEKLNVDGIDCSMHKQYMLDNQALHFDLFLNDLNIAIEVDGIFHYKKTFTQEHLEKTKIRDKLKNELAKQRGFSIIRIKYERFVNSRAIIIYDKIKELLSKELPIGIYSIEV